MLNALFKSRPNPFRIYVPQFRSWFWPLFKLENWYFLKFKFQYRQIHIDTESTQRFEALQQGHSHLLMCNHINFSDPYLLFEALNRVGKKAIWLAGVEPFESPLAAWHLQSVGGLSMDRGVLDKRSLQTFQAYLDEGEFPTMIFPEGEARYTSKTLGSFYSGASLFALNSATKQSNPEQQVYVWPITLMTRFVDDPSHIFQLHCNEVADILKLPKPFEKPTDDVARKQLWQILQHFAVVFTRNLAKTHGVVLNKRHTLFEHIIMVQHEMLQSICDEHLPDAALSMNLLQNYDALMDLKNKCRTLIARKLYAPTLVELGKCRTTYEALAQSKDETQITRFEKQQIGRSYETETVDKRLRRLEDILNQQEPYASQRTYANVEDLKRWTDQMEQTRQVKMLYLLSQDLQRQDMSWEGLDECLVKLEIGISGRFVYRGPKDVKIHLGAPVDVRQLIADHPDSSKKDLVQQLNTMVRQQIDAQLSSAYPDRLVQPITQPQLQEDALPSENLN